jgi:lysophospholipase L1-like esterase
MRVTKRVFAAIPAIPVAGAAFVVSQVLRAAHRSDLPSFPNQDPTGTFGDPDAPRLRIVALGDSSITAPGVAQLDNVWIRRIALGLALRYRVELIALAVGGSKAQDVIEGQLDEAVRLRPDIAVVSVGANDSLRGVRKPSFEQGLHHIVARLEEVSHAIVVLGMGDLGSIPRLPPTIRPYVSRRGRVFDALCSRVADAHPKAIKVFTKGRMSSAFWEDRSLFAPDQFHAGDEGHAVFAQEAMPVFLTAVAMAEAARGN